MKDDAPTTTRHAPEALNAWARHAAAGNGFGGSIDDNDISATQPTTRRSTMQMQARPIVPESRYARTIEASKRIRWDIDRDVIRGRRFDTQKKFPPDGLTRIDRLGFLDAGERRLVSHIQGRTYANMFGLVERYIGAKMLEVSRQHWLGDQTALEALVRFTDEELKQQALFRRIEQMIAADMPKGYRFIAQPDEVAGVVLGKSTWAVLALTCAIELFTQAHYRQSIEPDTELSELWKDVFLYHWKEESQHAILDELEWKREDAKLTRGERDRAVSQLIELVAAVDGIVQAQAAADTEYFLSVCGKRHPQAQAAAVGAVMLDAYRWQYITSGVTDERFVRILSGMTDGAQSQRIAEALAPIVNSA